MLHRKSLLKYSAIIFLVGILNVILFNVFHVPILTGIGNILVVDELPTGLSNTCTDDKKQNKSIINLDIIKIKNNKLIIIFFIIYKIQNLIDLRIKLI